MTDEQAKEVRAREAARNHANTFVRVHGRRPR
jgi:hypothetical protein